MPSATEHSPAYPVLESLTIPRDVHRLTPAQLTALAAELRRVIISTVSRTGGHLAPSLGVVELTLALLHVYDPGRDKMVWDVGHQAYAYKLLTGRFSEFQTLRQYEGVSGFPRMAESIYDHFGVGHSSTSISAALGLALARDLKKEDHAVLAVIGDGSMTAGLAYEGLNQAGGLDRDLVVVLNDNEMSISKNVGALSSFLSRKLSKRWVQKFKRMVEARVRQIPGIGDELAHYARAGEDSLKSFFTPGMLFEAFKFNYIGPINGHDLKEMINVFRQVQQLEGPVLVHVMTKKGKGYEPAESNPTYYHGVGCFEPETGAARKFGACSLPSYTDVFGSTLCRLAEKDERVVAITAAMPEGTGLGPFSERFPDRFFDVGICEQHAVTFAAGMATRGFKPVVAIYSTFLQRSYDQIIHDVCLQNLGVIFCLDRGGLVGEDGATHHGTFDISFLRHIPNLVLMAPKDEAELQRMLCTAMDHPGPVAIRYPRGTGVGATLETVPRPLVLGRGEMLRGGRDGVVIALGSRVHPALEAVQELEAEQKMDCALYNPRFVKPLPADDLLELARRYDRILFVEENVLAGGFSSAVLELYAEHGAMRGQKLRRLGIPDQFVEHGPQNLLRAEVGIDKVGIKKAALEMMRA